MNSYSIILPFINEINSLEKTIKVIKSDNQTSELEFLVIISKKLTTENDYNNLIKLSSRLIDCKLDIFYQDKPFVGGAIKIS